jgi:hypothetical protein
MPGSSGTEFVRGDDDVKSQGSHWGQGLEGEARRRRGSGRTYQEAIMENLNLDRD